MPSRAEGQIRAAGPLRHHPVAVILLLLLRRVEGVAHHVQRGAGVPPMRFPQRRVGEMGGRLRRDPRRGEEHVRGRDRVGTVGRLDRGFDFAHDGVDRRVQPEGLLDDLRVEGQPLQGVVGEGRQVGPQHGPLLGVEFFRDVRAAGQPEDDPRDGRRGGVLPRHEEGNHHVSDFGVRDFTAVFVPARHEIPDHVVRVLLHPRLPPGADDIQVDLGHRALRIISLFVMRQRRPRQHEIDGGEPHVEIVIEIGKARVKLVADLFALQ